MGNLSKDAAKAVDAVRDVIDQAIADAEEKAAHILSLEKQIDKYDETVVKLKDMVDDLTAENAELKMQLLKAEEKISEQEYQTLHSMYHSKDKESRDLAEGIIENT